MATDALNADSHASRLDRLDTRTRLVVAVGLVLAVVSLRSWALLGGAMAVGALLTVAGGVTARTTLRRLAHVEGFLLLLFVALPLTGRAGPFVGFGPLTLSVPGLERAVTLALRITAAALFVLPLVGGLTPIRLGHALGRLGLPPALTQVFLFTIRYVDLLRGEARRLHDAMRLRGFTPRTDLHTLKSYAHFVGQLLVRAMERAERISEAMICRGFSGQFPLVTAERIGAVDAVAACLAAGLAAGLLGLDRLT